MILRGVFFFLFDLRVLNTVGFKLTGESHFQSDVGLEVSRLPGVCEASQEVGRRNCPSCLRNQLLPKSVHLALGVLGMSDVVPVYLEGIDTRDRWISESRIDLEGGAEVAPLLVEILLESILCSSHSHGFLRSVEITQESRSDDRRESLQEICG